MGNNAVGSFSGIRLLLSYY